MQNNVTVSVSWLKKNLDNNDVVILDTSQDKFQKDSLYSTIMIAGARLFDIKNIFSDTSSEWPNTVPDPLEFQKNAQELGINKDDTIVVYDNKGIYSSPRAWWLFRIMGHRKVFILDGGLPEWLESGFEIEEAQTNDYKKGDFESSFHTDLIKSIHFIKKNIDKKSGIVIDARSSGRFEGTSPEPRKGLESGHIPGSVSLPYTELLVDGKFKSIRELKKIFKSKEIKQKPMVFTCGSGITACILMAGAEKAKIENPMAIFDGSWTEWASTEGMPIEKKLS